MQVVDAWRLFGPNVQTSGPAALVEVAFAPGEDAAAAVVTWKTELGRMADAIGLPVNDASARLYRGGAVLTFSAAIDVLLVATDVAEWAAGSAASVLDGAGPSPLEPRRTELAVAMAAARHPGVLTVEGEATRRAIPFMMDDEGVTIGAGRRSRTWELAELPKASEIPWEDVGRVPVALVTGTNGKTTSVRLLARILKRAGYRVGMTTTDGVSVDERLVVGGDYTGPAGAARVLRDVSVDAAVLETARGGILRRGLAVRSADVALLTNVSDDHIGHYGIDDLGVLARVKSVVGRVVPASGRVVVNADDPHLMAEAASFEAPLVLFSASGGARLAAHVAQGGEAWTLAGDQIVRMRSGTTTTVVAVRDVPLTFGGAALYNVANALGAAACASALGVSDEVIRRGLASFASSAEDNPGRGNLVERHGVRVLVDFAHNPDGIRNVLSLVAKLRGDGPGRLALVAGYAGDRSNASVEDAARAMFDAAPSRVFLRDLAGYLRGRAPGEVPARMMGALERLGLSKEAMQVAPNETEAVARALDWATPGDFVVVLAHLETAGVFELLGS